MKTTHITIILFLVTTITFAQILQKKKALI